MKKSKPSIASINVEKVKLGYLQVDQQPPLVIEPTSDDLDLVSWANDNQGLIESQLDTYGALLFRGFKLPSPTTMLEQFALTNCSDLFDDNGEHPREALGSKVYTPVFYPNDKKIFWHNENSFNRRSPMRIWFCCLQPSEQGGETPIVDSREVYNLIDPEIRSEFEQKQIKYIRNYNPQLGLSWQKIFQTTDKKEVEEKCKDNLMSFEWKEGDRLQTTCIRPSVVKHPRTGEKSWFNQAQHWHLYFLDPITREVFSSSFSEDELPRNCCYGDGSPIPDAVMEAVEKVYQKLEISFSWQKEDILMLDNILMAHARNPFVGERKLLVTMGKTFQYDHCTTAQDNAP
ncbi:TauD/TfdA family dioxygenase [Leptolyngbya cf. ectocarpi LEGE 11479]|uniref:TauD/TfdA family dioxygenase n=1 Tax=Leptolyngbya cf. ectocarpi LEGE 11479 TaxID=1828722 RepID=A0A928ZQM1_LEPEC|nr:TauD/TfdA family dioxygenase [Leptolyngbya ectocarpi]MBE9065563.1 TauD/TfdA family dioxygenase [Leptolyngbya cf. ectocarpi LEGE 11479]